MDYVIKNMETEAEIKGKAYVHRQSWHEAYAGLVDRGYLDALTLEKCEAIARKWPDNTLVAKQGERVIGFCAYGPCRNDDLPGADEVIAIYVLAPYYGKGVGAALMRAALDRLQAPQVAVWVLQGNGRAIRFYEKCGFRPDGCAKTITLGTPLTEVRMILTR